MYKFPDHWKVLNVTIHRAQKARLAELSKRCGRSQSNLVREALTVLFSEYFTLGGALRKRGQS